MTALAGHGAWNVDARRTVDWREVFASMDREVKRDVGGSWADIHTWRGGWWVNPTYLTGRGSQTYLDGGGWMANLPG